MSTMTGLPVEMTLQIEREIRIEAPMAVAWEALRAQLGPENEMPDGTPYPFTLEAWPGGRWFRDLGDDNGHLWGFVQVIKRPYLLEITGPMFMSYPVASHVQWRIVDNGGEDGGGVILKLKHGAIGALDPQHRDGVKEGWGMWMENIRARAVRGR